MNQTNQDEDEVSIPLKLRLLMYVNRWRRFCNSLIRSKLYNYISLIVITFNSILLTQHRYEDGLVDNSNNNIDNSNVVSSSNYFNSFLAFLNHICILIFLAELFIKFSAVGLQPFLENPWDVMDFFVIVFSTAAIFLQDISNISSLRVLRWLMPLYSDDGVAAPLRVVTETVFASLQGIVDVMFLSGLFIGLFAVAGVQLWGGLNDNRCFISNITCDEGYLYINSLNNAQDEKYQYNLYPKMSMAKINNNMTALSNYLQSQLPLLMSGLATVSGCGNVSGSLQCPSDIHPCLETQCLSRQDKYTLPYRNCNSYADCFMVMFNTFLTNDWSIDWEWIIQTTNANAKSDASKMDKSDDDASFSFDLYVILIFSYVLAYVGNYVGQPLYLCVVANVYSYVAPEFVKSKQQLEDEDISAAQTNSVATKKTSIAWVKSDHTDLVASVVEENNNNNDGTNVEIERSNIDETDHQNQIQDGDALIGVPPNLTVGEELDIWCDLRVITRQEIRDFNKRQQELLSDSSENAWFSKVQAELRTGPEDKRHISRCIVGYIVSHPAWNMFLLLAAFACSVVLLIDNPKTSFIDPLDSFAIIFNVGTLIFSLNLFSHIFAFGPRHCLYENKEMRKNLAFDCGIVLRGVLILIFPPQSPVSLNEDGSNNNYNETILEIEASDLIRSLESSLRLSFLAKFIFLVPPLRKMFQIAFRSIRSITYLSALSILVIFVFSIVGYHQFGELKNFGGPIYPLKFSNSWLESFYISFIVATGDIVIPYMRYLMKELPEHTRWMGVVWVMFIYYSLRGLVVNITACIAIEDVYTATLQEQEQQEEAKRILYDEKVEADEYEKERQIAISLGKEEQFNKKNKNRRTLMKKNKEAAQLISNHHMIQYLNNWWQVFMDLITGHVTEGPPPLLLPTAHLPKYGVLQEVEEGLLDIDDLEKEFQDRRYESSSSSSSDDDDDSNNENTNNNNNKSLAGNKKKKEKKKKFKAHKPEPIMNGKRLLNYLSPLFDLKQVSLTWAQTLEYLYHHPPMFETHRVFIPPKEKSLNFFLPNAQARRFALKIVFHPVFRWTCVLFCLMNLFAFLIWPLRIEIVTNHQRNMMNGENNNNNEDNYSSFSVYFYLELVMNVFFTLECITQIIAFGFAFPSASDWNFENHITIDKKGSYEDGIAGYLCANFEVETDEGQFDEETPLRLSYLSSLYNVFDFLGAIGAFMTLTSLIHPAFRLLRALRVARLLTLLSESESTFIAFCRALPVAATKILPLGIIVFTFVGVWGVELFQGKLGACNDRSIKHRKDCVGYFDDKINPKPDMFAAQTTTAGMIFGPVQDPFLLYPSTINKTILERSFYSYYYDRQEKSYNNNSSPSTITNNISSASELFFLKNSPIIIPMNNNNTTTKIETSRLRQRRWQITAYNFENLSEAFMCIFVIFGWASTSDILFNTWNAAPRVDEAMGHGSSPLGPLYIVFVYFVACVFVANCMCGFLMFYLLEFRKHYDETFATTEWLPEQRMALRQSHALRSLLHEKDVRERIPDPLSWASKMLHFSMRWAPEWFTEKTRALLDPNEKLFEDTVKKVEQEGEAIEENTENLLERAESITDFGVAPPDENNNNSSPTTTTMKRSTSASSSASVSLASAVRMMSMFKMELLINNKQNKKNKKNNKSWYKSQSQKDKNNKDKEDASATEEKQQSLTWSATELARIEPLSVFDTLVYFVIAINFICNCIYAPPTTSPEFLAALSTTIQLTLLFFTIELTMRFIAYKHHIFFSEGGLWYHVASREWCIDAFITLCGWLAPPALNLLPYAAIFSFLRVLKFKKLIGPRLSVIRLLEATENAHKQIFATSLIIGFGFFLFAVAGVEFFHGTVVPPLMVGWNTKYRHMNSTLPALKLLFDANSGDNWIDFPSDYIAGYRVDMTKVDHAKDYSDEEGGSSSSSSTSPTSSIEGEEDCFNSWDNFQGDHKFLDANAPETETEVTTTTTVSNSNGSSSTTSFSTTSTKQQKKICRNSKSLVRWYFALSDLILSIIGPAFVGAVLYDALVLGQDEIEDKCRISLLRFHRAWVTGKQKNDDDNNNNSNPRGPLPVGEFIRRVLTRLPRELTKFDDDLTKKRLVTSSKLFSPPSSPSPKSNNEGENNSNNNDDDIGNKNADEEMKQPNKENEDESSNNYSVINAATSVLPKPKELLSFLLHTPIPLRENNLVSFDGCLAAIIISGYKLNGRKAERVLGAKAFGKLAKMLNSGCKIFTVAHYVAVRIIWYYWTNYRGSKKYTRKKERRERKEKRMLRRKLKTD